MGRPKTKVRFDRGEQDPLTGQNIHKPHKAERVDKGCHGRRILDPGVSHKDLTVVFSRLARSGHQ